MSGDVAEYLKQRREGGTAGEAVGATGPEAAIRQAVATPSSLRDDKSA